MLPFTESSTCVQKIGYAISRTFQPYSFLLIKRRSLLHGDCAFMQNMHEQSPIALLRFFYCDLAVLIDPFLELAGFGILLNDLIDDLHEIVIALLHRYS